jgi:hypothetical protein
MISSSSRGRKCIARDKSLREMNPPRLRINPSARKANPSSAVGQKIKNFKIFFVNLVKFYFSIFSLFCLILLY